MQIKIGTLNLCLGLKNKKTLVKQYVNSESLDLLCMQEIDIEKDYNTNLLTIPGFCLEVEKNYLKARTGIYTSNNIIYTRRSELEGTNSHLIIIDIEGTKNFRLINIYRCFNPQEGISSREKFNIQLELINHAITKNTILMGDLNLDYKKIGYPDYALSSLFDDFDLKLAQHNLIQLVKFSRWERLILNQIKCSILDHVYIKNPTEISSLSHIKPALGDSFNHVYLVTGKDSYPPNP